MRRYFIYCMALFAILFANCTSTTEGLDEAEVLVVSEESVSMNSKGGKVEIEVNSFCSWKATSTEDWSWITPSVKKGGKDRTDFKLTLAENTTVKARAATITIANDLYGVSRDISISQEAGAPYIDLSQKTIDSDADGLDIDIAVESNIDYTISSSADWCKVSTSAGASGNQKFTITVEKSVTTAARTATVKVASSKHNITEEITVNQVAFEPSLEISETSIAVPTAGETKQMTVVSNISWNASCEADWVTLSPVNGNEGQSDLLVEVAANATTSARTTIVKLVNSEYEVAKEIAISQEAFEPSLEISESSVSAAIAGEIKRVTVVSNIQWNVTCEANWVTLSPVNGNNGSSTVSISVAANATTSARKATVKFANSEYNVIKEVVVNQAAFTPSLSVSETSISTTTVGATKQVDIDSNISWSATCEADWVTLSPSNGSKGASTLKVAIAANTTTTARATVVRVSNSEYNVTKEIEVRQSAFEPSLEVSETTISATISAATKQVNIDSNISWSATCEADWVTLSPASSSKGVNILEVTIAANATTSARTAVVRVSNSEYNVTKEIEVRQSAFEPSLEVSETAISATISAATKQVNIDSNISWSATCEADWVTLSPSNGSKGASTLKVAIAANTTTTARATVVRVSNSEYNVTKEISINQAAFEPSLEVSEAYISTTVDGETKPVVVTSNIPWSATCEADWVTLIPGSSSMSATLNIAIAVNATTSARTATVLVVNSEYGITKEITINQSAFEPTVEVSENYLSTVAAGEIKQVAVTSNVAWSATCEADWITISPTEGTAGTATLNIDVVANALTTERTATVKVINSEHSITKEIAVRQVAFEPVLAVNGNTTINLQNEGGEHLVLVNSNIDYNVSTTVDWITFEKVADGVKLSYLANYDAANSRNTTVTLSNEQYQMQVAINVTQASFPSSNVIRYTSSDNSVVIPYNTSAFGANIMAITYENGVGIIKLDAPATSIGAQAFYNATTLTSVTIPTSVTTIETAAFRGCSSLSNVVIPDSVLSIGDNAFYGCTSLPVVTISQNITSIGAAAFYNCQGELVINNKAFVEADYTSTTYPGLNGWLEGSKFTKITIGGGSEKIGNYAFRGITSMTNISIPNSVASIGTYAFYGCSGLKSVTIPSGNTTVATSTFYGCTDLESVVIPNGVTTIGSNAFYNCTSLKNVVIPESVASIGSYAFNMCESLTRINIPQNTTTINGSAFYGCKGELIVNNASIIEKNYSSSSYPTSSSSNWLYGAQFDKITLGSNIEKIGDYVFRGCSSLTTITIPDNVSLIGDYAFYGCSGLANLSIPANTTSIGIYAFYGCSSLSKVVIPGSVTTIGGYSFYNCRGELEINSKDFVENDYLSNNYPAYNSSWLYGAKFTKLTIGNNVEKIGNYAFRGCSTLTSVTIPENLSSIGTYAFYGCTGLSSVSIPNNVTSVGTYAFSGCTSLTSVTIPASLASLPSYMFSGCSYLNNVTIPDGILSIGTYAFYNCSHLSSVFIPTSVESIGTYAFYNCSALATVYSAPTTPPTCGSNAFSSNASGRMIYVPHGSLNTYKNSWTSYSSYISEAPYTPTECTWLQITADDVDSSATYTTIHYMAVTNGTTIFGNVSNVSVNGSVQSATFPANTSNSPVERPISYTFLGQTATTTITQAAKPNASYTVNLNGSWEKTTAVSNPDSSLYDGVYRSYSNKGVNNSNAVMYIDINGYDEFTIYIRSYAETSYDYTTASVLDGTSVKTSTSGKQTSGTAISNYTKVTYTGIGGGSHRITVTYRKDSSQHSGDDRGYLLIPKNQ